MTTPAGTNGDPLARAVLAKLAETHGKDTPLGSFARTVLSADASLREAANNPWHGEALGQAFTNAAKAQAALSPEARTEIEQAARRLAESAGGVMPNPDTRRDASGDYPAGDGCL